MKIRTTPKHLGAALAATCMLASGTAITLAPSAAAHGPHADSPAPVSPPTPASAPVRLGACDMMVTATLDSGARLQGFLPPGYRVGTSLLTGGRRELGVLMFWVLDCDGIEVPGRRTERARLSFITIPIETPGRPTAVTTTPRNFDLYTVFTHTDGPRVAGWLRSGGIPTKLVPGIRIDRTGGVSIEVPDRHTGYALNLMPLHPDVVGGVHDHDNAFWHEDGRGHVGTFALAISNATDTACYLVVVCGGVRAAPGSRSAALLGGHRRQIHMVFDHVGLTDATALLTRRPR